MVEVSELLIRLWKENTVYGDDEDTAMQSKPKNTWKTNNGIPKIMSA